MAQLATKPSKLEADDFNVIKALVFEKAGITLSDNKRELIQSRLAHRVYELQLPDMSEYRRYLQSLPQEHDEWQYFVNQLTTNKTEFFRELPHFQYLEKVFIPEWRKSGKKKLRIWSAACSTGEEPYSLAMLLSQRLLPGEDFHIEATDIDTAVLNAAANGVYHASRIEQIAPALRDKFLVQGSGEISDWYKIKKKLKEKITFSQMNLNEVPYGWKEPFDLIFCRNVLIYFSPATILKVVEGLYQAATDGGLLFIGHSESLLNAKSSWSHERASVYRKRGSALPAAQSKTKKRKVLVVDDSKTIRELLTQVLASDPELEVVGSAESAREAEKLVTSLKPDVMTLDIKMPEMDGVTFLSKLLPKVALPVVMVSSISKDEGHEVLRALELGAVDYVQKPSFNELRDLGPVICEKVKAASHARLSSRGVVRSLRPAASQVASSRQAFNTNKVLCVGASTGGTEAIKTFLEGFGGAVPPTVIVQHIPPVFSKAFADRLNAVFPFEVREAVDGDELAPGLVLVAPGGKQMALVRSGSQVRVKVTDEPPVNRHKPSVDVLFDSAAKLLGANAIGALLTGMGADGAKGLLRLKESGAHTLAQDEASCTVFGMPKAAIALNAAETVCSLERAPSQVVRWLSER